MYEKIEKVLREHYGISDITPEANFKTDLGLNSFDLMELTCIAEEMLGVEMEEEKYRNLQTVSEMCEYLEQLVREKK